MLMSPGAARLERWTAERDVHVRARPPTSAQQTLEPFLGRGHEAMREEDDRCATAGSDCVLEPCASATEVAIGFSSNTMAAASGGADGEVHLYGGRYGEAERIDVIDQGDPGPHTRGYRTLRSTRPCGPGRAPTRRRSRCSGARPGSARERSPPTGRCRSGQHASFRFDTGGVRLRQVNDVQARHRLTAETGNAHYTGPQALA